MLMKWIDGKFPAHIIGNIDFKFLWILATSKLDFPYQWLHTTTPLYLVTSLRCFYLLSFLHIYLWCWPIDLILSLCVDHLSRHFKWYTTMPHQMSSSNKQMHYLTSKLWLCHHHRYSVILLPKLSAMSSLLRNPSRSVHPTAMQHAPV